MPSIQPCRSQISDRFPVASFAIDLPRARFFEVACATDPRLFHVDWQRQRTPSNFYSSRGRGLVEARNGQTAWILPPDQLRRFAGARRIYYALGSYGGPRGGDAEFSISPYALDRVPSISLSPDFTGRSLDRSRLDGVRTSAAYGSPAPGGLRWGGDDVLEAEREMESDAGNGAKGEDAYDDGHDPELWEEEGVPSDGSEPMPVAEQAAFDAGIALEEAEAEPGARETMRVAPPAKQTSPSKPTAPARRATGEEEAPGAPDANGLTPSPKPAPDGAEVEEASPEAGRDSVDDLEEMPEEPGEADEAIDGFEDAAALYGAVGYDAVGYDEVGYDAVGYGAQDVAYGGYRYGAGDGGMPPTTGSGGEPEGAADAREAQPGTAVAEPPRPNGSAPTTVAPAPEGAAPSGPGSTEGVAGRDADYRDVVEEEELLPVGEASRALAVTPLDIPEKVRILRVVARAESGADGYAAINPDREFNDPHHPAYQRTHHGLSWGLIQFTQRSGTLGRVLRAIKRREEALTELPAEHRFAALFGPHADELLRVTNLDDPEARVGPVGGASLWEPSWTARFRAAGAVPHVTYAQNEVAITDFVDPMLPFAAALGFDTPRSLAILVDRCIHMGRGGGLSWIMRTVGPVRTQADRDAALRALGHADLRAFQGANAPTLATDGRWGPKTHAVMTGALRALGAASPVTVADRATMLARIVEAARGQRYERRVAALHGNTQDFSDDVTYRLV